MIRESPVGGYLDPSQPSLADTVDAVRSCVLIDPPNTKTRYSNIGPSIAGQILVTVTGTLHEYQQEHVLGPLGMTSSAFMLKDIVPRAEVAARRNADGRRAWRIFRGEAPMFDLGTIPAGNLYTRRKIWRNSPPCWRPMAMLAAGRLSPSNLGRDGHAAICRGGPLWGRLPSGNVPQHKSLRPHRLGATATRRRWSSCRGPKLGVVILSNDDIVTGPIGKLIQLALARDGRGEAGRKNVAGAEARPIQFGP